jgi:hypothetical protein
MSRSMVEVRWLRPGPLPAAVAGWFDSLPGPCRTGRRIDAYWIGADLGPEAVVVPCVKLRGVADREGGLRRRLRLEVKVLERDVGEVTVNATVSGRAEVWRKSVARLTPPPSSGRRGTWAPHGDDWVAVAKRRRQRRLAADGSSARLELTTLATGRQQAWSVALHAPGEVAGGIGALSSPAVGAVFDQWPPEVVLDPTASTSYSAWLRAPQGPQGRPPGAPPRWLAEAAGRLAAACVAAG